MSTTTLDAPGAMPAGPSWIDIVRLLVRARWLLLGVPAAAGALAVAVTFAITPTFTAKTTFLPPQQSQSAAATALASLGALQGLVSGIGGIRTPADQYVALMQSVTVSDRLIDEFGLIAAYDEKTRTDTRKELAERVRMAVGKKDGLISVEVDDHDPRRAAAMANRYVDELRRLSSQLALTEAQQRRTFFEAQLKQSRDRLARSQQALQASGFNAGALRAEPKATAETYARMKAEANVAEVRLQMLRRNLADSTPEVSQQGAVVAALRASLARLENTDAGNASGEYVSRYRDFKYEETVFELMAQQYELARLDESREGALIQVVDPALPPEKKSKPRRGLIGATAAVASLVLLLVWLVARQAWRVARSAPETAADAAALGGAWRST